MTEWHKLTTEWMTTEWGRNRMEEVTTELWAGIWAILVPVSSTPLLPTPTYTPKQHCAPHQLFAIVCGIIQNYGAVRICCLLHLVYCASGLLSTAHLLFSTYSELLDRVLCLHTTY